MLSLSLFTFLVTCLHQVIATPLSTSLSPPVCTSPSTSQPNPIANNYTGAGIGTGTANGTLAVIPIKYATARSIIPAQYPILNGSYRQLFPNLAAGMYPVSTQSSCTSTQRKRSPVKNSTYFLQMYIEMVQDHDLRADGNPVAPDFSVRHSARLQPFTRQDTPPWLTLLSA